MSGKGKGKSVCGPTNLAGESIDIMMSGTVEVSNNDDDCDVNVDVTADDDVNDDDVVV